MNTVQSNRFEAIEKGVCGPVEETLYLPGIKHIPHREVEEEILEATKRFGGIAIISRC